MIPHILEEGKGDVVEAAALSVRPPRANSLIQGCGRSSTGTLDDDWTRCATQAASTGRIFGDGDGVAVEASGSVDEGQSSG